MASSKDTSSYVVEDSESDDSLGVLAPTSVVIAGGQVEEGRAEGHGAGDEEEKSCEGHEAESF